MADQGLTPGDESPKTGLFRFGETGDEAALAFARLKPRRDAADILDRLDRLKPGESLED